MFADDPDERGETVDDEEALLGVEEAAALAAGLEAPSLCFTLSGLTCIHGQESGLLVLGKPVVLLEPLPFSCAKLDGAQLICSSISVALMRNKFLLSNGPADLFLSSLQRLVGIIAMHHM